MIKELFKLFFTANILVFGLLVSYKFYGYVSYVAEPLYKIRTNDGVYYSNRFKHFADTVTFLDKSTGETIQKSQSQLSGTVIERIR
jgi:hypothetical protein